MSNSAIKYPCSPNIEVDGLPYFARMCEKIRMMEAGTLPEDLHANLGRAMDLWTCQFLGVEYDALKELILSDKADDATAMAWAQENGVEREDFEKDWWIAYMKTCGFRDRLAGKLIDRIEESGLSGRDDIQTMFDYIDADEGR